MGIFIHMKPKIKKIIAREFLVFLSFIMIIILSFISIILYNVVINFQIKNFENKIELLNEKSDSIKDLYDAKLQNQKGLYEFIKSNGVKDPEFSKYVNNRLYLIDKNQFDETANMIVNLPDSGYTTNITGQKKSKLTNSWWQKIFSGGKEKVQDTLTREPFFTYRDKQKYSRTIFDREENYFLSDARFEQLDDSSKEIALGRFFDVYGYDYLKASGIEDKEMQDAIKKEWVSSTFIQIKVESIYPTYIDQWNELLRFQILDSLSFWRQNNLKYFHRIFKAIKIENTLQLNEFISKNKINDVDLINMNIVKKNQEKINLFERGKLSKRETILIYDEIKYLSVSILLIIFTFVFPIRYIFYSIQWSVRILSKDELVD